MKEKNVSKNLKILAYCVICAILFLLIATKSSPLYVFNDWVDSNIFFNMAKGIVNGKVPYRDLFEQKGPLLYFVYIIPYLISNNTFIGVYILEVIVVSISLYLAYKIVNLFCNEKASILTVPIFAFFALNTKSFLHGGSAEELCMPCVMLSLYILIKYFKTEYPNPISKKDVFINGILAGIVLWTKYTFLGFYIGYCLIIGITLLRNKKIVEIFSKAISFLSGMLIPTVICLLYFVFNNAVNDLFYTYFYINMTAYGETNSLISQLIEPVKTFLEFSMQNKYSFAIIILGYIYMIYEWIIKEKKILEYIMLWLLLYCSILLIYWGIGWTYYYFFFIPFMIFGFIGLGKVFEKLSKNKILFILELVIGTLILIPITYKVNNNAYMLEYKKEDVAYFKLSDIMHKYENPTLLVYNSIDVNLFTVANILPTEKYFFAANLDKNKFTDLLEEQKECVKNKEVDFVLVKYLWEMGDFSEVDGLHENYDFCGQDYYSTDGEEYFHFYLFKLKGIDEKLKPEYKK